MYYCYHYSVNLFFCITSKTICLYHLCKFFVVNFIHSALSSNCAGSFFLIAVKKLAQSYNWYDHFPYTWNNRYRLVYLYKLNIKKLKKKKSNFYFYSLPGQRWVLQFRVCFLSPVHRFPPYAGRGLVQVLVRYWMPVPHLLEHAHHLLQRLQPPFTLMTNK